MTRTKIFVSAERGRVCTVREEDVQGPEGIQEQELVITGVPEAAFDAGFPDKPVPAEVIWPAQEGPRA